MPGLLGKKIGMTSMFSDEGKNIPCTILEVGPCVVSQIKTNEIDGYEAVQIAYDEQKESRMSKALMGHLKKANSKAWSYLDVINLLNLLLRQLQLLHSCLRLPKRKRDQASLIEIKLLA